MIPKNLTTDARTAWHRENYARMKSEPARWAKEVERKRRSSAAIKAGVYRAHGPWAPLFAMQAAQ